MGSPRYTKDRQARYRVACNIVKAMTETHADEIYDWAMANISDLVNPATGLLGEQFTGVLNLSKTGRALSDLIQDELDAQAKAQEEEEEEAESPQVDTAPKVAKTRASVSTVAAASSKGDSDVILVERSPAPKKRNGRAKVVEDVDDGSLEDKKAAIAQKIADRKASRALRNQTKSDAEAAEFGKVKEAPLVSETRPKKRSKTSHESKTKEDPQESPDISDEDFLAFKKFQALRAHHKKSSKTKTKKVVTVESDASEASEESSGELS